MVDLPAWPIPSGPLEEKMTLFWHGHFATSNRKVNAPSGMYTQNLLFRRAGMDNFGDLLLHHFLRSSNDCLARQSAKP